jgi:His-Xaa-Ser system protein HxsD
MSDSALIAGVTHDNNEGNITFDVDSAIYPLSAVYGACFTFIDRAYLFIATREGGYAVTLRPKAGEASADVLDTLVGQFANELLACAYREKLTEANRATLESITMQAIGGAMGPPSLDELDDFDFSDEPFEDPLGIAMSWEEKYGKKEKG